MNRYALITRKFPREFLLLQGTGCVWKRCVFCDYHTDTGGDPFSVNREALARVTGRYGVLDVINSGSCMELDGDTVGLIAETAEKTGIHTLWFEAHWMYRGDLAGFAARFPGITVKFRTGIETFDHGLRNAWNKGIPSDVTPEETARFFDGVCLLTGVEGQTREGISRDIALACGHFEYFNVNLFCENTSGCKRDPALAAWVLREWAPRLEANPKAEFLAENTDLGVG